MSNEERWLMADKTYQLYQRWIRAGEQVGHAKAALHKAEKEFAVAKDELGNWLCPSDADVREQFCVWLGSKILTIRLTYSGEYEIEFRPCSSEIPASKDQKPPSAEQEADKPSTN